MYRDSPSVIRTRVKLVAISVNVAAFIDIYVLAQKLHYSRLSLLHIFGIYPAPLKSSIIAPLLLTACLFAGPLFEKTVIDGKWRQWLTLQPLKETLNSWTGYRNYIVGPLTEEILFRALIISLHLNTPPAPSTSKGAAQGLDNHHPSLRILIFITPLYFGIAHIHHCYEQRLTHPHTPFLPIFLSSLIQFAYTTIFGWYAAFLFLRTGSLWAVVAVHSFCNWMGLPRVWGRVGGELAEMVSEAQHHHHHHHHANGRSSSMTNGSSNGNGTTTRGKEDGDSLWQPKKTKVDAYGYGGQSKKHQQGGPLGIWWTVAYYAILVGGAVGWWFSLWPLTESDTALIDISV